MAKVGASKSKSSWRGRTTQAVKTTKPAVAEHKNIFSEQPNPALASSAAAPRNSWQLLKASAQLWRANRKIFGIYLLVVAGLSLLLVHNFGSDASQLKGQVSQLLGGSAPVNNLATYAVFVGNSSGAAQGAAAVYQYLLLLLVSLSAIWLLRQLLSDKLPANLRVRDAFYQGMYPLIPFMLVLLVLTLYLLPLVVGTFIYSTVVQNGIAVGIVQDIAWLLVLLAGAVLSIWLLATYYLAVYIVTLPNMTPVEALRSARKLARGRRPSIIRKSFVLILAFMAVSLLLFIPAIAIAPKLTGVLFFALGVVSLPFLHSYFYLMYRDMLHE